MISTIGSNFIQLACAIRYPVAKKSLPPQWLAQLDGYQTVVREVQGSSPG